MFNLHFELDYEVDDILSIHKALYCWEIHWAFSQNIERNKGFTNKPFFCPHINAVLSESECKSDQIYSNGIRMLWKYIGNLVERSKRHDPRYHHRFISEFVCCLLGFLPSCCGVAWKESICWYFINYTGFSLLSHLLMCVFDSIPSHSVPFHSFLNENIPLCSIRFCTFPRPLYVCWKPAMINCCAGLFRVFILFISALARQHMDNRAICLDDWTFPVCLNLQCVCPSEQMVWHAWH